MKIALAALAAVVLIGCSKESHVSEEAKAVMARTEAFHKHQLSVKIAAEEETAFVSEETEKCKKKDPTKPILTLTQDQFLVCAAEPPKNVAKAEEVVPKPDQKK